MLKTALTKLIPFIVAGVAISSTAKVTPLKETDAVSIRGNLRAAEIIEVVESMVSDPLQQEAWERSIFMWEYKEGGWYDSPPGSNDDGNACGVLQIHAQVMGLVAGTTCTELRKNSKLSVKVALTYLLEREKTCGSKAAAWTAYSTKGSCPYGGKPLKTVQYRCYLAGLTTSCEVPAKKE